MTLLPRVNRLTTNRWETAVLPLLREERGSGTSTVEERVIGAGLQALEKNEDGPAVKMLFYVFAVTQVSRPLGCDLWHGSTGTYTRTHSCSLHAGGLCAPDSGC